MRFLFSTLIYTTLPLCLFSEFPIEPEPTHVYESEGSLHEIPWDGDSSFSDDVDLDSPEITPPGFETTPAPPNNEPKGTEELVIDLKNPSFSQGVVSTEEGGVITGPSLRIQAKRISYTNKTEQGIHIQTIVAEGDLLLEYEDRAFVGSKLEYDFVKKTGHLYNGKTFVDIWFLGGDRIDLKEDGSFYIQGAFITTSESQDNAWEIDAQRIKVTEDKLFSAKNIHFRFLKIPFFWFPSFKGNLKAFTDPPIRYKVIWDKGLGPRITTRYRAFAWRDLNLFFRLDYRLKRGFGGAIESEYFAPDKETTFVTRSYGARDKTFPDEKGKHRYRLQGLYHRDANESRTQMHITWDKFSDSRIIGDFRSEDFEINTEKRTRFFIGHQFDPALIRFNVEMRANAFDSIDQELPLFYAASRPTTLGSSGILSTNMFSAGYLKYVFANDLRNEFHKLGLSATTRSMRVETRNTLSRPFTKGPCTLTPYLGVIGILYSNNPSSQAAWQGIMQYGFDSKAQLYRSYKHAIHLTQPYISLQGLTSPTSAINNHFYFDLSDGFHQLNEVKVGWKNLLIPSSTTRFFPSLALDLYTLGFLGNRSFAQTFPKTYLSVEWLRPSYQIKGGIAWNQQENVWDFSNISTDITVSEDIAFGIEMRHRSRFDWRKADHTSFILDVAKPISELVESPLSDRRNTLLTRSFFRLNPKWHFQVNTKTGWGRKNEPAYNAMKFDLTTLLTCSWQWRFSYERMPNDNRFSSALSLVK